MTPEQARVAYKRTLPEEVSIRRYTGTGQARTYSDFTASARVTGYRPSELLGTVTQGDQMAIVLAKDLTDNGLILPVTTGDRIVVHGKEHAIASVDGNTRRVGGELIAYEIGFKG